MGQRLRQRQRRRAKAGEDHYRRRRNSLSDDGFPAVTPLVLDRLTAKYPLLGIRFVGVPMKVDDRLAAEVAIRLGPSDGRDTLWLDLSHGMAQSQVEVQGDH